jgi:hypothetical protein
VQHADASGDSGIVEKRHNRRLQDALAATIRAWTTVRPSLNAFAGSGANSFTAPAHPPGSRKLSS